MASWVGLHVNQHQLPQKPKRLLHLLSHNVVLITWDMWEPTKLVPHAINHCHPWGRWQHDGLWMKLNVVWGLDLWGVVDM